MTATAYPLTWPTGFDRAKNREAGRFKTTLASAIKNVQDSLRLFSMDSGRKLESLVISSNVSLGVSRPADPGVAVWFVWDGMQICIAVDRYSTVEGNLQAIHHIIEARRVELRHGTLALVRATFQGFRALPAPTDDWRKILGAPPGAGLQEVRGYYRQRAATKHPDKGGSAEEMAKINKAWEQAQKELE
jgi:hypothetical protein